MLKKYAIFTIVRNEKIFLPIWYKYYSQFFDKEDIYLIDDSTFDGSTDFLDKSQIKRISNEFAFSHQYLLDNVTLFRNELLKKYEYVIFTESDEILFHKNFELNDYLVSISNRGINNVSAIGYEIFHDPDKENVINLNDKIVNQRNYWFRNVWYDKLLISNKILNWCLGFHTTTNLQEDEKFKDDNLFLIHLHRFDYLKYLERKLFFKHNYKHNDSPKYGSHNKFQTIKEINDWYFSIDENTIEKIPDFIKQLCKV